MIYKFKTEELGIGFDFDVEFEENQKVNCIIGKNGIGKTQLLESMAKSLIYTHSMFLVNGNYQYKNYFIQKDILEKTKDLELKLPLEIELNGIKIKNKIIISISNNVFKSYITPILSNFIFYFDSI